MHNTIILYLSLIIADFLERFWKWRRVIGSFAFIIVILTSCVIAYISNSIIPGFTLPLGFPCFCPLDPIAD
ncbi:hypothetical protein [Dyadobacter arcticus]|uniref:NhaP-type Na+/H+ or K+/H+ antiporter n=1 Tax=Dyadobacter arcticus TaxID=1078754 RepID=A0ABX0UMX9_9BACT|nr:hypothetical protein [Dyadobacter arcticus]NIJ54348.1 NhaP-type Na+/H+ or K+/H+ antiporter [Dyadobacter arcticus]